MHSADYTYFDLETLPSQDAALLDKFRKEVTAPAQYKKPESIEKWLSDNADAAAKERLAKTSFDPAFGHICTIAWALDDGDIEAAHARDIQDELDVLASFFSAIDPYHSTTFVGHYINGFDIRFALCRAVVLGVNIPSQIPRDPKPWGDKIADTMVMWAGQRETISMDNLCAALGIEGKGDFDGSMVADAWANGEHDKIVSYCKDDVRRTREIHRKFLVAGW